MKLYPLKFRPIFKERIWGGRKLAQRFNKDLPVDKLIGESWELADLPQDKSIITNGQLAGQTIDAVLRKYPNDIMGKVGYNGQFPILVKLLDAQDVLSVQVHPDEDACVKMGKGNAKTECWYIVEAAPKAVIYKGVKKGTTKEKFAQGIQDGTVDRQLEKIPVKAGECHFLPAGTVHAIGAGLLIAEIQMPSDTTYRVFDWNRLESNGKPRELHIKEALESTNFDFTLDKLPTTSIGRLVDCKYFKVDKCHQLKDLEVLIKSGVMKLLVFISGSGELVSSDNSVNFSAGDTVLIPAQYEGVIKFRKETEYLTVTI